MKIIIIILIVLCVCGCSTDNKNMDLDNTVNADIITTEEVFNLIDSTDIVIIDVREEYEYKVSHIKNSYNIPLNKLDSIDDYGFSKDMKIIVYCQSGRRSEMAASKLISMGYTNVFDMSGIDSWEYELVTE